MLAWISANSANIILVVVLLAAVGGALAWQRYNKKHGKGCCGSCNGCPHAGGCHK